MIDEGRVSLHRYTSMHDCFNCVFLSTLFFRRYGIMFGSECSVHRSVFHLQYTLACLPAFQVYISAQWHIWLIFFYNRRVSQLNSRPRNGLRPIQSIWSYYLIVYDFFVMAICGWYPKVERCYFQSSHDLVITELIIHNVLLYIHWLFTELDKKSK